MSKIIKAINVMASNPDKISSVESRANEIYFKYQTKYNWSIKKDSEDIVLYYYSGNMSIETLMEIEQHSPEELELVRYSAREIKTPEAYESFNALHTVVTEKLYGVDDALDDIIDSEPLF